jgi:metal transporter CNNM
MAPAPKARVQKGHVIEPPEIPTEDNLIDLTEESSPVKPVKSPGPVANGDGRTNSSAVLGTSPKTTFMRRTSAGQDGNVVQVRANANDMREHLKHLGPSNLASRPKTTRYQSVKIKPAHVTNRSESRTDSTLQRDSMIEEAYHEFHDLPAPHGGEGEGLLKSAGRDASDGVLALQQGYGSMERSHSRSPSKMSKSEQTNLEAPVEDPSKFVSGDQIPVSRSSSARLGSHRSDRSSDTLGSLNSQSPPPPRKRGTARSGSITENIVEAGGVRKVVLETNTSSSSDERDEPNRKENLPPGSSTASLARDHDESGHDGGSTEHKPGDVKKKRRRTRKKKGGKAGEGSVAGESIHGE